MGSGLEIRVDDRGDFITVTVGGEIDLASAPALERALAGAVDRWPRPERVEVDLAAVSFLGSNGVTALAATHSHASARGTSFAVVASSPQVDRLLELTGLGGLLGGGGARGGRA